MGCIENLIEDYIIEHKDSIYRLAFSYVKNQDDALDVVQDSIYKAFASKGSVKTPNYIKTWFYRIVVNTSLDALREKKKVILMDDKAMDQFDFGKSDYYENLDLKRAMEELPEPYHSIITLRYFEDLKIAEIASILKSNLSTVKAHLYHGLKKLRVIINDEYWEEGLE